MNATQTTITLDDVRAVSPTLEKYTQSTLIGNLWGRPDLTPRDRSIVTLSALIARAQTIGMPHYFNKALDSGVTPAELSEIITHLAFYAGWPNAFSAVTVVKDIFAQRGIGPDQFPEIEPQLLPLDESADTQRAAFVQQTVGPVSEGLVHYTDDLLFRELWLRPALMPRDRSLATVSALIAAGHVAQVPFHLNRAMDNGLKQSEASEILNQLAFYSGWPAAMSAVPVVKEVFESRSA